MKSGQVMLSKRQDALYQSSHWSGFVLVNIYVPLNALEGLQFLLERLQFLLEGLQFVLKSSICFNRVAIYLVRSSRSEKKALD